MYVYIVVQIYIHTDAMSGVYVCVVVQICIHTMELYIQLLHLSGNFKLKEWNVLKMISSQYCKMKQYLICVCIPVDFQVTSHWNYAIFWIDVEIFCGVDWNGFLSAELKHNLTVCALEQTKAINITYSLFRIWKNKIALNISLPPWFH